MTEKQIKARVGYAGDVCELLDAIEAILEEHGLDNMYTAEELVKAGCVEIEEDGHSLIVSDTNGDLIGADWLENEED